MNERSSSKKHAAQGARSYLQAALQHIVAAGRDIRDLGRFAKETLGDEVKPHVQAFLNDVEKGRMRIEVFTGSVRTEIFGHHVSESEREHMIREAAYLRAARRGFIGGSADEDWYAAEREIDERLAAEIGLLAKGREALHSAGVSAEHEIETVRDAVTSWLQRNPASLKGGQKKGQKPTKAKKTAHTKREQAPAQQGAKKKKDSKSAAGEKTETAKKKRVAKKRPTTD